MSTKPPILGLGETITSVDVAVIDTNSEWLGVSRLQLMENAGRSVAEEVLKRINGRCRVAVYAGPGGNGGDGLTAARHLAYAGCEVEVLVVVRREQIHSKETLAMLEALENMDYTVELRFARSPREIGPTDADVVVDALLGVGLRGAPRSPYSDAIEAVNASSGLKVAVDVPSGLNADTGETPGVYVKADVTVTFHKMKPGLLKRPDVAGQIVVASIGAPPESEVYIGPGDVLHRYPRRSWRAHKGSAGRVLVVGGSREYVGAPILAALAAERAGVDLVYLAAPFDVRNVVMSHPTIIPVQLKDHDVLHPDHIQQLENIIGRVDSIAVGMGLGLAEETTEALNKLLKIAAEKGKPVVVDADGLKHLSRIREILKEVSGKTPIVLTPHQHEFQILFSETLPDIDKDINMRIEMAAAKAAEYNVTLIVKGPIDIITNGRIARLNKTGAPAMSCGGTGDVLAGLTAALLAKKLEPIHAAAIAAFTNGLAGMLAYTEKGESITALDVIEKIPEALNNPVEAAAKAKPILYKRIVRRQQGKNLWQQTAARRG